MSENGEDLCFNTLVQECIESNRLKTKSSKQRFTNTIFEILRKIYDSEKRDEYCSAILNTSKNLKVLEFVLRTHLESNISPSLCILQYLDKNSIDMGVEIRDSEERIKNQMEINTNQLHQHLQSTINITDLLNSNKEIKEFVAKIFAELLPEILNDTVPDLLRRELLRK